MAINKLDFTGIPAEDPLRSLGANLRKYGDSLHQQEKDRLAAIRQDELLNMQRAEHQMKVDAVAQAAKEKEAANKYADVLNAAVSGNVVGIQDQKALGERIALLGSQAEAAGKAGDVATQNKLIAEQSKYIDSSVPKMVKAYEESPDAQLQVLRASNPLGGTKDMALQTRLALLKEAEAPIEKTLERRAMHKDRLEELKEQDKLAAARQQIGFTHAENLAKTANEKEDKRAKMLMSKETYINSKGELIPGNVYMDLKSEEQKEWANTSAKKDLLAPKTDKMYGVINDNGTYRIPKEGEKPTELVEASVFNKIVENDEKSTGSTLAKTLSDFSSGSWYSTDHKAAATSAANEAGKLLNANNVPLSKANSIINAAVLAAKDKEGTFNKDVFDLAIQQGMLSKGVVKGDSGNKPIERKDVPTPNESSKKPQELTKSEQARQQILDNLKQSEKNLTEVASRYYSVIGGDPKVKKELTESKQQVARLKKELASMYDPTEGLNY